MGRQKYSFSGVVISLLKSLGYVATWFIISQLASFVTAFLLSIKHHGSSAEAIAKLSLEYSTQTLIIANALTLFAFILFYSIRKIPISQRCEIIRKPFGVYIRAILLGIVGQFAIQYLLSLLMMIIPESWLDALSQNNEALSTGSEAINFIAVVLLGPIFEEILCRGLMLGAMKRAMPKWIAVVLSSLIFGILHANPIGIIYATLFGILLGFIAVKFNSILPAIICHIAFNATSLSLLGGIGALGLILLNASVPLLVVLIVRVAKYKEPIPSDDEDEE